ncbi:MAG: YcgJ family protein [Candidatus Kaistia colombiensis]|nr:MAG: YcgJ family protein [Kaistia sp.]
MKTIAFLAVAALALTSAGPSFAASKKSLNSPRAGVLCDKYICADAGGISRDLTARYLGRAAAKRLSSQGSFDTRRFTLANGVFCDTVARSCYKDRYFDSNGKRSAVDPGASSILFGKP